MHTTPLMACLVIQEAEALQAEVKLLQAEASQLRRDNELKAEMEGQYARRGAAQVILCSQLLSTHRRHLSNHHAPSTCYI